MKHTLQANMGIACGPIIYHAKKSNSEKKLEKEQQ